MAALGADKRAEIEEVTEMLTSNLEKIVEHGQRADGIVKSMLAHSRGSSGERQSTDINGLVEETLNLAFHGARAQDQGFNITLERELDRGVARIELVPQEVTRVFLNLFSNGFYAATKRSREAPDATFRPVLKVTTRDLGDECLRHLSGFFSGEHDRRAVRVVRANEVHHLPLHALKAHPDVGLDVLHNVADVKGRVGVGQRRRDEERARRHLRAEKEKF